MFNVHNCLAYYNSHLARYQCRKCYTIFDADCPEDEFSCPNFEFECKSAHQWTKCLHGRRAGHCVARRLQCDNYDQCMDNFTSVGCREFRCIVCNMFC